jgi:DNA-binding response OmpR family regulator/HPt (histidine-containing phosphotransfer) domain-containing protein
MKILLVEDDETLIAVLTKSLVDHHYVVDAVNDGEAGWRYASTFEYGLIVLDIMLPKLDGITLCQRLRAEGLTTPILLLTAQDASTAKVRGLDAGADDYVVKPFDSAELIARMRALLRRGSATAFPLLTWGDLCLNPSTCEVTYGGKVLSLTAKEYDLLELLLRDGHHVLSTEEILDRLWSSEEFPAEATVRSHVRRLRHKLEVAGAPHDLISTMHGRGYYLKLAETAPMSSPTQGSDGAEENSRSTQQVQYLAFLNETWMTTKPKCLDQVNALTQMVASWQFGLLSSQQLKLAQHIIHKLAGTLGLFGLTKGMQLARHLEHLLNDHDFWQVKHGPLMGSLLASLTQEIQGITLIESAHLPTGNAPLLLIVDSDTSFTQPLVHLAENSGIQTAIALTLEQAQSHFTVEADLNLANRCPDAVLLRLSLTPAISSESNFRLRSGGAVRAQPLSPLNWLKMMRENHPHLPILVVGKQDEFRDRLEVTRQGASFLLEKAVTPAQIIAFVAKSLSHPNVQKSVMIVDDDQDWLQTLPNLLKPWGFQVTTLANPQEFWTILQQVNPDALVLDVKMPEVNGFEICQVLRNDPQWQRLPVLFLSVLTDLKTQNEAFTVGADDYLCKPVKGADLANRILNRLQRMDAWAS